MALPDLHKYYQAAQLRALAFWFPQRSYNRWTEIEKIWMAPIHPNSMLWNANVEVDSAQLLGPMLHLRSLWRRLSRVHGLGLERSLLTSFLYNPRMPAGLTHQMSFPWATRNLFHFGHLVHPCTCRMLSFLELQKKFYLPRQVFYGYPQIRHYAQSFTPNLQFSAPTPFESLMLEGSARRGLISDIYGVLNSYYFSTQGKHIYASLGEGTGRGNLRNDMADDLVSGS